MSELRNHLTPESRILKRFDVDPSDVAADRNSSLLSSTTCAAAVEYTRHAPAG